MYLRTPRPSWRSRTLRRAGSRCTQLIWLTATGAKSWRLTLGRALPKGSYALYSRASGGGLTESPPQRIAFKVR
jgi:hypothetical protein